MARHLPGVVWSLRDWTYKSYIKTFDTESLEMWINTPDGMRQQYVTISRRDARLLAKRLNRCLDATTAKGKVH